MNILNAKKALKKYFGYDSFREGQAEVIQSVYDGRDALVLMPTGGGKSLTFQIPALTMEGITVVISPLISLMQDQVSALKIRGIKADYINSSQTRNSQLDVEQKAYNGELDLIYVSPEKVLTRNFSDIISRCKINLIAIDEAHCISSWGHDFRPEYANLGVFKTNFPNIPILALTATADNLTRKDIREKLNLTNPKTFVLSFDRPNLSIRVLPGINRFSYLESFIRQRKNKSGIIYCLSRKSTEQVSAKLNKIGIKSAFYHARLSAKERHNIQNQFSHGKIPIICATIAFGMGIDKSDVRWIIHYNMPKNIESYYQEIGRAGRDGAPADTLLFYSYRDVMVYRDFVEKENSNNSEVQLHKIERMKEYCESLQCRKKLILNYFDEFADKNCGNCDNCLEPPEYFDGTKISQIALSAVARLKEKVGSRMLINVLRGSRTQDIFEKNYHKIKTYGVGNNLSFLEWNHYISQIISLGILYLSFDENSVLKLTDAGKSVLFEGRKVNLAKFVSQKDKQKQKPKRISKKEIEKLELVDYLSRLRLKIAREKGLPPYIILSDAILNEIAERKPLYRVDFLEISGITEQIMDDFGFRFINMIRDIYLKKFESGERKIKGITYIKTLELLSKGFEISEILKERELAETTIASHLVKLHTFGEEIDFEKYITQEEIEIIRNEYFKQEGESKGKYVFEKFDGKYSYFQINLAINLSRENYQN